MGAARKAYKLSIVSATVVFHTVALAKSKVFSKYTRDRDSLNYLSHFSFLESRILPLESRPSNLKSNPTTIMSSSTVSKKPSQDAAPAPHAGSSSSGMVDSREHSTKASASVCFPRIPCPKLPQQSLTWAKGRPEPQRFRSSFWCFLREI
jgi:hypothetical protein